MHSRACKYHYKGQPYVRTIQSRYTYKIITCVRCLLYQSPYQGYIRPPPNIFLEPERLLPKLRLAPSEFRGRLELVGFMGDNIEGIKELPEFAPVCSTKR